MRRGLGSCATPLSGNKPPPLTIVASTLSYRFQRSMPPCASIIRASSSFIRYLLPVQVDSSVDWCTLRSSVLCDQHHAEPRFALHHSSVGIRCLFDRNCFDHRTAVLFNSEVKRCLRFNRSASEHVVNLEPSVN